jgi:hypothetical protein
LRAQQRYNVVRAVVQHAADVVRSLSHVTTLHGVLSA